MGTSRLGALRRGLPVVAILIAAAFLLSDWPLGWSGWGEHPFVAAFVAGLVLLLLTGSVVDVILQRREARRWVDLGRGAAYALDQVFFLSGMAMFQLLGAGGDTPLTPEIEFHVASARTRARTHFPDRAIGATSLIDYNEESAAALCDERLPALLADAEWRDHALMTILTLARAQEATIARWVSAFGVLGDAEGFRRVGRSIVILDRAEVVVQRLLVVAEAGAEEECAEDSTFEASVHAVVTHWRELGRAYYVEAHFWEDRHAVGSGLGLGEYPITQRRAPDRSEPGVAG